MQNRITQLFETTHHAIKTIYYTAGYPNLGDTLPILEQLALSGADMVEIGMPFSDPIADGETIQQSNQVALANGMRLTLLFEQLADMRAKVDIPVLLMGYINPVLQFGVENFCQKCQEVGIDGLILPDLTMQVYAQTYESIFKKYGLCMVFLITPQTSLERIKQVDELSRGFIYAVSSSSTTGKTSDFGEEQTQYFEKLQGLRLKNPILIGFGVSNKAQFEQASQYGRGAIVGSAFIKAIGSAKDVRVAVSQFIASLN